MKNIKNKVLASSLALAMAFSLGAPMVNVMAEEAVAPQVETKTELILHKLEYSNEAEATPEIQNTGGEMDLAQYDVKAYDPAKSGKVEFSVFKLKEDEATRKALADNKDVTLEAIAKDLAESDFVEKLVETKAVENDGSVKFSDLAEGRYAVVETLSPATVTQKAKSMLLSLPVTNAEGTGYEDTIHLYPKNKVDDSVTDVVFTKSFTDNDKTSDKLENALFDLYKGTPGDENAEVLQADLKTNAEGQIVLKGLKVGEYYLIEKETEAVDGLEVEANEPRDQKYLVGTDSRNDEINALRITVNDDGTVVTSTDTDKAAPNTLEYMNWEKPYIKKSQAAENGQYEADTRIQFTLNVDVPGNIKEYSVFKINDSVKLNGEALKDSEVISHADSLALETDTGVQLEAADYTAKWDNASDLSVELTEAGIAKLDGAAKLVVTYDLQIDGTKVQMKNLLENDAVLTYRNGPNTTVDRLDKDKVEFKSFGRDFTKVDGGLFGTGIAKAPLQGAEFILSMVNEEGKTVYFDGFDGDMETPNWVEAESAAAHYAAGKGIFVSDENGKVEVKGLKEGTYKLIEMKAPEGFELSTSPELEFNLGETSEAEDAIEIINNKRPDMPMTGTEQTIMYAGIASAVLVGGIVIFTLGKKRKEDETNA